MKRRIVVKGVEECGYILKRHGASHDVYEKDGDEIEIPRHKDINENTAKAILKKARGN